MKRKNTISPITKDISTPEVLRLRNDHEAAGYRMTNMKEIILHNTVAFDSLISGSYAVSAELKKHIPKRSLNFFSYTVATGNKCLICGNYFKKIVTDEGITGFKNYPFNEEEKDLIAFGEALVDDPNHVPDEVYEKLQARYDEETMVLLVTHAVFTLANNYFNNI